MASSASFFVDDIALTALEARVPNALADTGMFAGGSNSPGIGISTENPGLAPSLPSWTLLDQFGNVRVNQIGQHIGGPGISAAGTSDGQEGTLPDATIRLATQANQPFGDGSLTDPLFGAALNTLLVGWEAGA